MTKQKLHVRVNITKVSPDLKIWSITGKENLEIQQKHALRTKFLRTLFCSNDTFNTGYNRKMLIRKRTSILDWVCSNYEKLFHPVQCTACRLCQCSSRDKVFLQRVTRLLWISLYLRIQSVSVTVHDNTQLVCIGLEVSINVSLTIIYCPF